MRLGPGYPETHFHYGKFLMEQKRIPEAVEKFRKTVELSPAHVNANLLLNALTASSETVTTNLEKVAELNPTPENLLNLSLQYYRNKRYEDCIAAAQQALALKPDYAEAYNNICSAYNNLKQWDNAISACGKALAINPEYTLAKNNLEWAIRKKAETSGQ